MSMKTDSIALAARGKVVCQDVARHGKNYIIVADGCSSSPHSEVGAMLLAMTARNFFENRLTPENFGEAVIYQAFTTSKVLGLPDSSMDATLIIGYETDETFRVLMYGDGVVWHQIDHETDWPFYIHETFGTVNGRAASLPHYLSYKLNQRRSDDFLSANPGSFVNGKASGFSECIEYNFEKRGIVGVSTDGINAITGASSNKISAELALSKFLTFPVTEGAFLARRAWATVNRERWTLNDDFGMAVAIWK